MSAFVKLLVNIGLPDDVIEVEMLGATTLRYGALRVAEVLQEAGKLRQDIDEFRWFLIDPETKKVRRMDSLAAEWEGIVSELGCQPLNATVLPEGA